MCIRDSKRIDNIAGQDDVKHDIGQAAPTLRGNQLLFSGHHTGYNQSKQHSLQIKQLSHSSAPVSYTHLDVYKRQVFVRPCAGFLFMKA